MSAPTGSKLKPRYPPVDKSKFPAYGSVEVSKPTDSHGPVRRNPLHRDALVERPKAGIDTVTDILFYNAREHGTRNALGWRDIVDTIEEEKDVKKTVGGKEVTEKKTWKYFQLSEYHWLNHVEVKDRAIDMSKGLVELGLEKGQIFNIYAATAPSWQLMQHACMAAGLTIATAYDTLGESGLTHSLNEPDCVGVFTNAELLPTVLRVLPNTPTIKVVIYDGKPAADIVKKIKTAVPDREITALSQDELRELGKDKPEQEERRPKPTDIACIMYTSGTTGAPKGVVLSQANLIAAVGAIQSLMGHIFAGDQDTFLAFLPLAHILEYVVELAVGYFGLQVGYGRIRTLTDASVRNCQGDLKECKPTIMIGVPQIWETIRKGILHNVNKMGAVKKSLFRGSMSIKKAGVPILSDIVDSVVFSAVRAQTGGRLRYVLNGGAALSVETQQFLSSALVTVLQGYGLTESCGMCTILPPEFLQLGNVGLPSPSVELKLVDVPEAGYKANADPSEGEIWIRGTSITKGYYKRDDLNSDPTIFPGDGWFRTGDVGQWQKDGTMIIIDRVKNLVKLSGGEYIALERLEMTYKTSHYAANLCVHATSESQKPIVIIFPHEVHLREALGAHPELPAADTDLHTLCEDQGVKDFYLKDMQAIAKKNGFKAIEVVQGVVLSPEEWTPESGLVTAAQKVQRKAVEKKYLEEIKACYKASQGSD